MNALDLLYAPLALVTAPWWARKKRSGWGERFGGIAPLPAPGERPRVLLHAVSVGEVGAIRTLVELLSRDCEVVVSAATDTGLGRARELYASRAMVVRYPLDFSGSVRRFLDAVRPDAVALVELEVWPNFVRACEDRGIPVCVVNGRLSERSFRGYRRLRRFIGRSFARLAFAGVQDEGYAERFRAMGVAPERCIVTGTMKWDSATMGGEVEGAEELARELGIDRTRPLIVAGSTGPLPETLVATPGGDRRVAGEEALLHEACPAGVQLLCAPRKPERFAEGAEAMPGCVRRSTGGGDPASGRFLLDTIGELRKAYALADLVVVGRSFGTLFGSDPLEPAAMGKAIVIGPATSDFAQVVRSLEDAGGIVRSGVSSLGNDLRALMADASRRAELGRAAGECVRASQGASARTSELVAGLARGGLGTRSRREPARADESPRGRG